MVFITAKETYFVKMIDENFKYQQGEQSFHRPHTSSLLFLKEGSTAEKPHWSRLQLVQNKTTQAQWCMAVILATRRLTQKANLGYRDPVLIQQ